MMTAGDNRAAESGEERLLSVRTVKSLLDCSDRTLRRWISAGKFPRPDVRIGRSLRWRSSTITGFIQGEMPCTGEP